MKMKLISMFVFGVICTLYIMPTKADDSKQDELTLRNQLFADVFLLKEGVDRLQISVEVLNKRHNNQMEILKGMQSKLITNDSEEKDDVCDKITGMFNTTLRKYNILETQLVTKLTEIQNDQTARLDEIIVKQTLNKNCGFQGPSSTTLLLISSTLSEVSEKIDKFEEKFLKLEALEKRLNLDKFADNQLKILQEINEKISKNQEQFTKIGEELANLKDLKTNVNNVITNPHPKLPMEVILGLTSSNITNFK